jgi:putative selenate reductase FAD-binding subunit
VGGILRPETVKKAVELGSKPGFAFLGGGTRLNGKSRSSERILISLEKLGLSWIEKRREGLSLGATAVFQSVLDNPDVPKGIRQAVAAVSSRTLRNMMTIGGELALRSPSSVLLAVFVCLAAEVRLASKRRTVGIEEHIAGGSSDLILSAFLPAGELERACDTAILRRTSHAPPSLVVAVSAFGLDPVKGIRIVVGDGTGGIRRLQGAEKALEGRPLPEKGIIEETVKRELSPKPDIHASSEYKLYMAGVMVADLLYGLRTGGAGS